MTETAKKLDFVHRVVGIAKIGVVPSKNRLNEARATWDSLRNDLGLKDTAEVDAMFASFRNGIQPSQEICGKALAEVNEVRLPFREKLRQVLSPVERAMVPRG